jgi:hypothetical protein
MTYLGKEQRPEPVEATTYTKSLSV